MTLSTFDRLRTIFHIPASINLTPQSAIIIRYRRLFTTAVICVVCFMLEQRTIMFFVYFNILLRN